PIRKVNEEIRAIRSSKLDVRLDPRDVPIELAELVFAFNDMLARIEEGFTRLSHFSADIAHELRTPVTNLVTQTHVALGRRDDLGRADQDRLEARRAGDD
ncbi:HAMP domain-containing protein, partial [Pseudomonas aeruginosa]|uniref:HAMP domain-containing protein n=1 Tax=Pseudomonas aeruginosa TaxID=287 RepID=UPI0031B6A6FF